MCLRELDDVDGLAQLAPFSPLRSHSATTLSCRPPPWRATLRICAQFRRAAIVKPGNLALALIEAGLIDEFDTLRADGAFALRAADSRY